MGDTLLIVAVGMKPDVVQTTILEVRPQRVLFVVSDDAASLVDPIVAKLPRELGINRGNYAVASVGRDQEDAGRCMSRIRPKLQQEIQEWSETSANSVTIDITTGTKPMSIAILMLARRWQFRWHYSGGPRNAHNVVQDGGEKHLHQMNPLYEHGFILVEDACNAFNQGFPEVAARQAEHFKRQETRDDRKAQLSTLEQLCQGYAEWNRFQHGKAASCLKNALKQRSNFKFFQESDVAVLQLAEQVEDHVRWLDSLVNPGPDADRRVALDLVANSMRAAGLHRYDDAVARLYRACEMHAQNRLRELGALAMPKTTVRWDAAPPSLQQEWLPRRSKEGTLMLGLRDLYRLLHALGDELGQRFEASPLSSDKSPLEARNNSILAHGNSPLTLDSYEGFRKALEALMAISQADLPKPFPRIGPANLLA